MTPQETERAQYNFKIGPATAEKFEALADRYGGKTAAFIAMVERMHHSECISYRKVRQSYDFHSWLIGYNNTNETQYRPRTVPDELMEQYLEARHQAPADEAGGGE